MERVYEDLHVYDIRRLFVFVLHELPGPIKTLVAPWRSDMWLAAHHHSGTFEYKPLRPLEFHLPRCILLGTFLMTSEYSKMSK